MSCTILIYHYESLAYLRACVRQVRKYAREDIPQHIIIADQSLNAEIKNTLYAEFAAPDITIRTFSKYGSGFSIDAALHNGLVQTEYLCTIDVDTLAIHPNWLYVPIKLIEEFNFSFVGVHAGIESAYAHMGDFYCIGQYFRVGKTEKFKELSFNAGFAKSERRNHFKYINNQWYGWSDDSVVAHWWEDQYTQDNKFTFKVDQYLGIAPLEARYGRYTDDLVFHFGLSYNWKHVGNKEEALGSEFLNWMDRMEKEGLTEEMLDEMLSQRKPLENPLPREVWDGISKRACEPTKKLNQRIEELKSE